jgi:broad specificity phosphatase PhoE
LASLYLVRHGQASFGTDDYDRLSDLGARQAREAGDYLNVVAGSAVRIVCGSHVRQRDTAAEIARGLSGALSTQVDERFDEADFDAQVLHLVPSMDDADGALATLMAEAKTSSRSYQKLLRRLFRHWQSLPTPVHRVEGWEAFGARVEAALQDLVRTSRTGETTIVITSAAVIATLVARVLGLPADAVCPLFEVMMNCSVTRLLHDRERVSLSSFNECSYLARAGAAGELLTYR